MIDQFLFSQSIDLFLAQIFLLGCLYRRQENFSQIYGAHDFSKSQKKDKKWGCLHSVYIL